MTAPCKAIVVGASVEEFAHVRQCLSDWDCMSVPLNDEQTGLSSRFPAADLAIVFAREEQERTFAISEQLRAVPDGAATPLLLVVGRYEISQGTAVGRTGRAGFIITPFGEKELRGKIEGLLGSSREEGRTRS